MIFAIPIEIKIREFLNKIYLANKILELTDCNVIFGKKIKVYDFFKRNKNIILLSKGGVKKNFKFSKDNLKNNKIMILDEEGPIFNIGHFDQKLRTSKFLLSRCENFILWGKKDISANNSFKIDRKKFPVLGHPKFDLLKKPQSDIFQNQCKNIKKKFGKFILISSNFNGGDSEIDSNLYYKYYQNTLPKHQRKKNTEFIKNVLKADLVNYHNMIDLIIGLAKNFPNINFVFRPHPRQNIKLVKKRFPKNIKNIKVIYQHTITPWIINCEYFLHSGCSTVFEASILKKKIIYFIKEDIPKRPKTFSKLGYKFGDVKNAKKFIVKLIKGKTLYNINKSILDKNIIENFNNKNFSYELCKIINKINFPEKINKTINLDVASNKDEKINYFKRSIKQLILKSQTGIKILNQINPNLLLTKEYKDKKYKKSSLKEIKDLIKKFSNIEKSNTKFKISKLEDELYYIENKKKIPNTI